MQEATSSNAGLSEGNGEKKCEFCHNLNPTSSGGLKYQLTSIKWWRQNPPDCVTCSIVEQALSLLEPDWAVKGAKHFSLVSFTSTEQSLILGYGLPSRHYGEELEYELFVKDGKAVPWSQLGTWRYLRADASLSGRLETAKKWIRQCSKQHKRHTNCSDNHYRPLPKRVLDLRQFRPDRKLMLQQQVHEYGRYACLSYCWGSETGFCLTEDNEKQLLEDVPWDSLPQTYKDAVLVTAGLGIPFLWIDALCITQNPGNPKDWEDQSTVMHEIYGNAFLCIAAANAQRATDGFLSQRRPFEFPNVLECDDLVVYGRKAFNHTPFIYDEKMQDWCNPLRDRGWCFQEHVLSRRILHFGEEEMFFECKESTICECGLFSGRFQSELPVNALRAFLQSLSRMEKTSPNKRWMELMAEYSCRKFSNANDRLPAISGLAKMIQHRFGNVYLAGHWAGQDLLESLLWFAEKDVPMQRLQLDRSACRAPTWSWASIKGGCAQPGFSNFKTLPGTEVLEALTHLATDDPTGAISYGHLRIRGVFMHARVIIDEVYEWDGVTRHVSRWVVERNGTNTTMFADLESDMQSGSYEAAYAALCWYVGTSYQDDNDDPNWKEVAQLIVLRQYGTFAQLYERVGRGRVHLFERKLLEGWEQCWKELILV